MEPELGQTIGYCRTAQKTIVISVGYGRTSSKVQRDDRTIDIQVNAMKKFAEEKHFQPVKLFLDDGVSGNTGPEERPGLSALLDYLKNNPTVKHLIITRYDRLARNLVKAEAIIQILEKLGVKLVVIENPDLMNGANSMVLLRHVMGSISQYEKTQITERLTEGRIKKAKEGLYSGGKPPLGYETVEKVCPNTKRKLKDLKIFPEEAAIIKMIFNLKKNGKGIREITRHLNKKKVQTSRTKKWYPGSIRFILQNSIYHGQLDYKGIVSHRPDLAIVV